MSVSCVSVKCSEQSERQTDAARTVFAEAVALHTSDSDIAAHVKRHFDRTFGTGWNCVVGRSFGTFVTHDLASFAHMTYQGQGQGQGHGQGQGLGAPLNMVLFKSP